MLPIPPSTALSLLKVTANVLPTAVNSLKDGFQPEDLLTIGHKAFNSTADEFLGPAASPLKSLINFIVPSILASLNQNYQ
ncbi:hypothetical protein H0A36_21420 [Endozoicomonas sp. SM1973]|uniref:Uncharacterized protein n=1 Tax=Spartinivicinus marinus TaxID=2994442 RepID=A0A853I720_9GAMM|nr:hypothetical protein [Spartinivicinus marinus]MCX4027100.1 hypothetical protein [Spartinivicinus marinus]NYZ68579.1 hypothetical protein [Spartinivicinus marinus]